MNRLAELIERVERLTGPDREVDGAVHNALFGTRYIRSSASVTGWFVSETDNGCPYVPRYTASLDAAIALTERVMPPHALRLSYGHYERPAAELLVVEDGEIRATIAYGATMAIALVLATLKALAAREGAE